MKDMNIEIKVDPELINMIDLNKLFASWEDSNSPEAKKLIRNLESRGIDYQETVVDWKIERRLIDMGSWEDVDMTRFVKMVDTTTGQEKVWV